MEASRPADLRPLSVGEILDVAIKICTRHVRTLAGIVVLVVAPIQVLSSLVATSAESGDFETDPFAPEATFEAGDLWLLITAVIVAVGLTVVAATLATAACFKAIADAYLGERPSRRESLAFALRRLHSVLWITVLGSLVALVGLLFCIAPGIWLYVSFAVAVPVLLTEGLRGRRALGRSRRLVGGRWWPTFAVVLVGTLFAGIVTAVVEGLLTALTFVDADNDVVAFVTGALSGTLSSTITTPFTAAFVSVLYFDLRVRKEGFDLELLAERVGLAPRPEGGVRAAPVPAPPPSWPPGEQPPYWPPPPGWRPSSDQTEE